MPPLSRRSRARRVVGVIGAVVGTTVTFVAASALPFMTKIWNVTVFDGLVCAGPLFTTLRSMLEPLAIGVVAVDALFAPLPSFVELLTVAVLLIEAPGYPEGTLNVAMIVEVWPEVSVPSAQGNGVVQAPLFEMNVRPDGVGSVTKTFAALSGPLFVTAIV